MTESNSTSDDKSKAPPSGQPSIGSSMATPVQRGVEKLAESNRFETVMAAMGTMGGNPLHNKMTPEHISQVLKLGADHDEREFTITKIQLENEKKKQSEDHIYRLFYFIALIILLVVVIAVFRKQPTVLVPILTGIGGVVTGFLAGAGWSKSKA